MQQIKFLIFVLTIFLSLNSFAQAKKVNIKVGETEKKGLNEGVIGTVGNTSEGYYVLRLKGKIKKGDLFIDFYNNDLELKETIELEDVTMSTSNKSKSKFYEFFAQDNSGKIFFFYSIESKSKCILYKSFFDTKNLTFKDESIVVEFDVPNKDLDRRLTFSSIRSADKSKIAIFSSVTDSDEKKSIAYVEVFDNSFKSLWKKTFKVPVYSENEFKSSEFSFGWSSTTMLDNKRSLSLSNEGVLNLMTKVYEDSKKGSLFGGKKDYVHLFYSFSENNAKPISRALANKSTYIVELMIKHDRKDNLRLAGYFSKEEKLTTDGVMFLDLDPVSLKTNHSKLIDFTDDHKRAFLLSGNEESQRSKAKQEKIFDKKMEKGMDVNISAKNNILDIYTHKDNSITLSAEYYDSYITTTTTRDGTGGTSTLELQYYVFGDLKFVNISPNGEINWIKNYDKDQRSDATSIMSVADFLIDDDIYFIYNDIDKKELRLGSVTKEGKLATKTITYFGKKGALEKFWLIPSTVKSIDENTSIGIAKRIFKKKIVKFSFK